MWESAALGVPRGEIAKRYGVSERTVSRHIQREIERRRADGGPKRG